MGKKIKIAYNLLPYSKNNHGGAEIYIKNIIKAVSEKHTEYEHFIISAEENYKISNCQTILCNKKEKRIFRVIQEQLYLPFLLRKNKIDIVISNYVSPILFTKKKISIIHDMQYKDLPQMMERSKLLYWNLFIPLSIRFSQGIGTVSYFSASRILNYFPISKNKIFVTVEGVRESLKRDAEVTCDTRSEFLLSVLSFGKHKNLYRLIDSMKIVKSKHNNIQLKLIGGSSTPDAIKNKKKLIQYVEKLGLTENIDFLGFVEDEELKILYQQCKMYVFPSLYEGFGLPIIEAQENDAPVLCSELTSLPEIGGDSCLYFDPYSIDDMAQKIIEVFENPKMIKVLVEKGTLNIKKYKWGIAGEQLINEVNRLCSK